MTHDMNMEMNLDKILPGIDVRRENIFLEPMARFREAMW